MASESNVGLRIRLHYLIRGRWHPNIADAQRACARAYDTIKASGTNPPYQLTHLLQQYVKDATSQ
jgi:hypothetical protein